MTGQPVPQTTAVRTVRGRTALWVAVVALLLKVPQAILMLLFRENPPPWMPQKMPAPNQVSIALVWLLFNIAALALRKYLGVISAIWFAVLSALGGVALIQHGPQPWGVCQLLASVVVVLATVVAFAQGAFRGARW